MRVDKYLKNSRVIKRRTVAKDACEQGRVKINNKTCKPGDKVVVGDVLTINFGTGDLKLEVLSVADKVKKSEAENLYKII